MKMDLLKFVAASSVVSLMVAGGAVNAQQYHNDAEYPSRFDGIRFPYELGYGLPARLRITCTEGSAIVDVRGYNSVRMIECRGNAYTYLGHRYGGIFKVTVNAMTGRIASADRIKAQRPRKGPE
jgi:hypothetical protein